MEIGQLQMTLEAVFGGDVTVEVLFDGTPAEMPGVVLPGERAIEAWMRLRRVVEVIGAWPIVLGPRSAVERHAEALTHRRRSVAEVLAAAADVDPDPRAWFADIVAAERTWHVNNGYSADDAQGFPEVGPWPEEPDENDGFSIPFDIVSMDPHREVVIALVPTEVPWTIPAHLGMGGWNACPEAAKHCALWKRWNEEYGAEPVGVSGDVVEFLVERPPTTRDAALELAWQQHGYCQDIVDQGTQTIAGLAGALLEGRVWFFWWD